MVDSIPNPVAVGPILMGNGQPLTLIAGPCVMEPGDMTMRIASRLVEICDRLAVPLVFKASYDKANRTSVSSYRGPGLDAGLKIFARIKAEMGLPVTTDIHETQQAAELAETVDLLQVPAFLARQTDLLEAAARTGRPVNVKKGQFMAPWDMGNVVTKLLAFGSFRCDLDRTGHDFRVWPPGQRLPGHSPDARNRGARGLRRHSLGAASGCGSWWNDDLGTA